MIIQEELERRMLYGLACEWEEALRVLKTTDQKKFRKPLFSLKGLKNRWGYWSGEKNEICLSRKLVLNHSWDAVREVLLHEMAHQFTEQVMGASDESQHGLKFQKACHLLRANPRASGNYRPLDERISQGAQSPEDRILLRVQKLMALAQSHNQYEAEAAMAKAHELIAKYNIDLLARDEDRIFVSVSVGSPALRHFREEYYLSNLLQDYYFVYGIWISTYVLEKGKMGSVLEISGTVQNVKIAEYVYDFVKLFIDSQWSRYNEDKSLNRYRKTDFSVGVIEGFRSKLRLKTRKEKILPDKYGLMKLGDPLLRNHIHYRYPHTTVIKGKDIKKDEAVLKDGICAGKELIISKGITMRGKKKGLLIGTGKRAKQ